MNGTGEKMGSSAITATPYLCVKGAAAAIEFYKEAFGAEEIVRLEEDSGRVAHAEVQIGGAAVYLADEFPEIDVLSPQTIGGSPVLIVLQVPDASSLFHRAVAAGAVIERPLADGFDGAHRTGKIIDPFGHHWLLLSVLEEMSPEKLQERYAVA